MILKETVMANLIALHGKTIQGKLTTKKETEIYLRKLTYLANK